MELSPNLHQRRYPNHLREQIVAYTDVVLARGGTYTEVERDLGVSGDSLRRFHRERRPFRVLGPCCIEIDFADMEALTDFIRHLSC